MPDPFHGDRVRVTTDPATGETRAELTPEYAAWWAERIHRSEVDERAVERWLMGGMVGRLVRRNGGPIEVEACDPEHDGELRIHELEDDGA